MADNTVLNSGSGGDTIATEDRGTYKTPISLLDVGGRSGAEAVVGDSGVAMPVRGLAAADAALSGNPVPIAVRGSAAAPTDMSADNDATIPWALRNGSFVVNMAVGGTLVTGSAGLPVAQQGTWTVGLSAGTNTNEIVGDVAHDAAIAGNPVTIGARASAAAPSDVSADDDAVRIWALRNGSPVVNLAAGGTLVTVTSSSLNVNVTNAALTVASHAVTNAGTFAVQVDGSALTALQLIDDVVFADDAAFTLGSSKGVMAMGFAGTQSVDANDACALSCTTAGSLHVTVDNTVTVASHAVTNAGTFAVQVDGSALTALQLIDDAVVTDDAAYTLGTDKGFMIMGFAGTQSVNANDACALACSTAGALFVTVASGGIASGAVASGAIASGAVASGAFASGALAAGSIATGAIADMLVDDAAFTPATSRVMPTGFQADEGSTDSVDEGDIGCPRMTLDRKVIVTNLAHTAGGATAFYNLDVDESEDSIKTTAGMLYNFAAINLTNALLYLKFYNATVANVTVGTTAPLLTFPIPGNNDTDGAGITMNFPVGVVFDTAITIAATTSFADADTGAPATNALIVSGSFK